MKTATAYFNIEMNVICPHCNLKNDLEDRDADRDHLWLGIFRKWIGDWRQWKDPKEVHDCDHCSEEFLINNIER